MLLHKLPSLKCILSILLLNPNYLILLFAQHSKNTVKYYNPNLSQTSVAVKVKQHWKNYSS